MSDHASTLNGAMTIVSISESRHFWGLGHLWEQGIVPLTLQSIRPISHKSDKGKNVSKSLRGCDFLPRSLVSRILNVKENVLVSVTVHTTSHFNKEFSGAENSDCLTRQFPRMKLWLRIE